MPTPPAQSIDDSTLDAQTIEHLGISYVRMQLQRDGIEVAQPARDHGIDLIAYIDRGDRFYARPIQVKATLAFRWVHHSKYARFPDLFMVYVMHLGVDTQTTIYATNYRENHAIADNLGYLKQKLLLSPASGAARVWKQTCSDELEKELERYRVRFGNWRDLIIRGSKTRELAREFRALDLHSSITESQPSSELAAFGIPGLYGRCRRLTGAIIP